MTVYESSIAGRARNGRYLYIVENLINKLNKKIARNRTCKPMCQRRIHSRIDCNLPVAFSQMYTCTVPILFN